MFRRIVLQKCLGKPGFLSCLELFSMRKYGYFFENGGLRLQWNQFLSRQRLKNPVRLYVKDI